MLKSYLVQKKISTRQKNMLKDIAEAKGNRLPTEIGLALSNHVNKNLHLIKQNEKTI